MKRVSVYASCIQIEDGPVLHSRPGQDRKNLVCNSRDPEYLYILDTSTMVPTERFSLMAAGKVCIHTLTEDESGDFYDLKEKIITDQIMNIEIRQFLVGPITDLSKNSKVSGFVKLDIEF